MPQFEYKQIPIDQLSPNPLRPRNQLDREKLLRLADSIRQYGLFTPLLVGRTAAGLQIIAGERRWRAAKIAGLTSVPAMVVDASSIELILLFLEENLQREPINLIEQANALQRLLSRDGFTLISLANRFKLPEEELQTILNVLELPEKVKESYLRGEITDRELIEFTKDNDPLTAIHKARAR